MPRYYIEPEKTYNFPSEIFIVHYGESILVISPETANWIVLNNDKCLQIIDYLRQGLTIKEVMDEFEGYLADVKATITQLEGKRFCNKVVSRVTDKARSLHLYTTNKCNLNCPHCYMFSGSTIGRELLTDEIIKLFRDYKNSGGQNVTLSGGEPTLRPDFDVLVKTAFDLGLKVRVLTNGSMLTKERIDAISPYLDSIQISIDGFSEESDSIIRGNGHFRKAMSAIDYLVSDGVSTSVAITPSLQLLEEHIEEYSSFAEKLAKTYSGDKFMVKFSESLLNGRDICPSKRDNDEYYKLIQTLRRKLNGPKFEIMSFVHSFHTNTIMDNCMFGVFAIASNGDVYFCARTSDLKPVANIRTHSFSEILQLSDIAEKATRITNLKPCGTCDLRYICGGGCRIDEFKDLVDRTQFDNIDYDSIPPRRCNATFKNRFYRLMIESNPYMYSEIK